jgi:hypothetical protein
VVVTVAVKVTGAFSQASPVEVTVISVTSASTTPPNAMIVPLLVATGDAVRVLFPVFTELAGYLNQGKVPL